MASKLETDAVEPQSGTTLTLGAAGDTVDLSTAAVTLPAVSVTAGNLASSLDLSGKTVTLPSASVTSHVTAYDDAGLRNDISTLALHSAIADNKAAYNLSNSFIDQYEDSTGIDVLTQCLVTDGEYIATIYTYPGNDSYTKLLLHMDGANDGSVFTDSSDSPHTASVSGAVTKTAIKKFGTASGYWASSHIGFPDHADWNWGSGAWTVDLWIYNDNQSTNTRIFSHVQSGPTYGLYTRPSGQMYLGGYSSGISLAAPDVDYADNTWTHLAWDYDGSGTARSYINGVVQRTQTGISGSATSVSQTFDLGRSYGDGTGQYYAGYMDEVRVSKGIARYEGAFTPNLYAYGATTTYATGNYTSTTETANATVSKMGVVVLYKNEAGTATLNTDLIVQVSADGGSNYVSAPLTAAGTFSTGILCAKSNDITISNTGTAPKYKISFANQSSGTKETQVHGVALLY